MCMVKDFIHLVKKHEKIIVYGCGNVGKTVYRILMRYGIDINCFTVSKTDGVKEYDGTPIYTIDSLKEDMDDVLFIVATAEKLHDEIISTLYSFCAKNILTVSDELFAEMKTPRDGLYKNAYHERNTHYQYKELYCRSSADFTEKYNLLVKGLDNESVQTINLILARLEILFSCKGNELDLFDEFEKDKLKILKKYFYDEIRQLEDGTFVYEKYCLPQRYFDPNIYFYKQGIVFFQSLNRISKGDIIDAGAFIGDSSLLFAKMTTGTVYAWEAMRENCESIKTTLKINDVHNVEIVNKAVGNRSQMASIEKNKQLNWSTMLPYDSRDYKEKNVIEMQSIDDFVEENNLQVSLIKLHVEGMEFDAIHGAERTLRLQKPALIIHIHHTPRDFFNIKPYIESLGLGYRFKVYKPVNGSIFTGTMLLAEV